MYKRGSSKLIKQRSIKVEGLEQRRLLSAGTLLKDLEVENAPSNPTGFTDLNGTLIYTFASTFDNPNVPLLAGDGTSAGTKVLGTFNGTPTPLVVSGSTLYFEVVNELWKTNGTAAGTVDIANLGSVEGSAALGNTVFFRSGSTLWRSDGTTAGTTPFWNLNPQQGFFTPVGPVSAGGILYFDAIDTANHGQELWKSDGTVAGTAMVKDIFTGPFSSTPQNLTAFGNQLCFSAVVSSGSQLWITDGTSGGTVQLSNRQTNDTPVFNNFTNVGGTLFFTVAGALWKSDGTSPGTALLNSTVTASNLVSCNSRLFFANNNQQVWTSDGTSAGTTRASSTTLASTLTTFGNNVAFIGSDNANNRGLWMTDGTIAGTHLVAGIGVGTMMVSHGVLFLIADDGVHNYEPWRSDGTTAGTVMINDYATTPLSSNPSHFVAFRHEALFTASSSENGYGIYRSDGTAAGTGFITQADSYVGSGSFLFYTTNKTLWSTDGTANGERPLATMSNYSTPLYDVGGTLVALDSNRIWRSDGTAAGTADITPASFSGFPSSQPTAFVSGSHLYFSGLDATHGNELWVSDGTAAGTKLVKDINPGVAGSNPQGFVPVTGGVVFAASDNVTSGLWFSDGTAADTHSIINTATGKAFPFNTAKPFDAGDFYTPSGGRAFFFGTVGASSTPGLFVTDGTAVHTTTLAQFTSAGQAPLAIADVNGVVYAAISTTNNSVAGFDLWRSDGTVAGTQKVKFIADTTSAVAAFRLINLNGTLYIQTRANGLWTSNGTATGTVQLSASAVLPTPGVNVDGSYFYGNFDSTHGTELWLQPPDVLPAAPLAITGFKAVVTSAGELDLSWTNPTSLVSSIYLEKSVDPTFTVSVATQILFPGTSSFVDTDFTVGTKYYYRLTSRNLGGVSPAVTIAAATGPLSLSGGHSFYLKGDGNNVDVWIDSASPGVGTPSQAVSLSTFSSILFHGIGATTVTIDESGGEILPPIIAIDSDSSAAVISINLIGGSGNNTLTVGGLPALLFNSLHSIAITNPFNVNYTAGGGNDSVKLVGNVPIVVNMGAGNLTVTLAAGTQGTINLGASNGGLTINGSGNTFLVIGTGDPQIRFASAPQPLVNAGLISGYVYNDANANGRRDSREVGIPGRKVYLDTNKNGKADFGEPSTITGKDGSYHFTGLAAGRYVVREVVPQGWSATSAGLYNVALADSQARTGSNFAQSLNATISGSVYNDANRNGKQNPAENGLSGWTVFLDANNNGRLDIGEQTALTDSRGKYDFNLVAGKYVVRIVQKPAYRRTSLHDAFRLTVGSGGNVSGNTFGEVKK